MAFRPGGHPQGTQDDGEPVHGRALRVSARVSQDPTTLPAEQHDDVRDIRSDEVGRVWVRTPVGGLATQVQGNVPHDDPDSGNPVKTGGHATASPRAQVSADGDRVDHSADRRGRQRVRVSGEQGGAGVDVEVGDASQIAEADNLLGTKDPSVGEEADAGVTTDSAGSVIAQLRGLVRRASEAALGLFAVGNEPHDDPDTNNPVKVGGHANASPRPAVSAEDDRADASTDLRGRFRTRISGEQGGSGVDVEVGRASQIADTDNLLGTKAFVEGNVAHDDVDSGNPVKGGGRGRDAVPAAVSADDDRVDAIYSREGRQFVNQDLAIAGENQVHDYLAVHTKALDVEQGSWDDALGSDAASLVVKSSAGRLRKVIVSNDNAAVRYLMIFNATSLPASGTEPDVAAVEIPADSHAVLDLTEVGAYFDTGITIGISEAIDDLNTNVTAGDHDIFALFK